MTRNRITQIFKILKSSNLFLCMKCKDTKKMRFCFSQYFESHKCKLILMLIT